MRWFPLMAACGVAVASLVSHPASATAGHGLCHKCLPCQKCVPCCPPSYGYDRGMEEPRRAVRDTPRGEVIQAPLVPTMPMFAMPMMMPVMPAMATMPMGATRGGDYRDAGYRGDCCEKVDKLEAEMKNLAKSVSDLQTLMQGQNDVLKILAQDYKSRQTGTPVQAPIK